MDLVLRFVLGGVIVAAFAVAGQLFKPATFSGIFGAAPSVAIASLALLDVEKGRATAMAESRAMVAGAAALVAYGAVTAFVVRWRRLPSWLGTGVVWSVWLAIALPVWAVWLR